MSRTGRPIGSGKGRRRLSAALLVSLLSALLSGGCTVAGVAASAVDVATDVVVTTVDLTTDAVVTGVDLATGGDAQEDAATARGTRGGTSGETAALPAPVRPVDLAPRHGNWCGVPRTGRERIASLDRVDDFCRDHAVCRDAAIPPAQCDAALVRRLGLILPDLPAAARAAAEDQIAYYSGAR